MVQSAFYLYKDSKNRTNGEGKGELACAGPQLEPINKCKVVDCAKLHPMYAAKGYLLHAKVTHGMPFWHGEKKPLKCLIYNKIFLTLYGIMTYCPHSILCSLGLSSLANVSLVKDFPMARFMKQGYFIVCSNIAECLSL